MDGALDDARQRLVDETLVELQELIDRRNELLREMFGLIKYVRYAEDSDSSDLPGEEEMNTELERFLERFDLQKNPQTGSALTVEIPELSLKVRPSRQVTPTVEKAESVVDILDESGQPQDAEDDGDDLQYPTTSSPVRIRPPRVVEEDAEESMGVDVSFEEDGSAAPEEPEEIPIDVEEEDVPEPRTPPRTRARTRTSSPIALRRRKRRRSDVSEKSEVADEAERPSVPSHDARQTRSKSRKVTPFPSVPAEDDDKDELDIISLSSPHYTSPVPSSRRRTSPHQLSPQTAQAEGASIAGNAVDDEQVESREAEAEEVTVEAADDLEQEPATDEIYVPPSPSMSSVHSPPKSPLAPWPPFKSRESPIRAPKPRGPVIVDNTPLTPPRSPPPPIVVQLPLHQPERPVYCFSETSAQQIGESEVKTENEASLSVSDPERARAFEAKFARRLFQYSLPPLSVLPVEFNRKGKPTKSRRRDKERERTGSEPGKKDDWVPQGMTKWAALLLANPAHRKLSRATKCVTTKDWNTASTELKLIRTFERIDMLKRMGKWGFRQLKKQRVAAGLVKTHWDYLLDEMKWMQTDFREERRWKMALAYELALDIQEWHAAGSHEERIRLGICGRWRKPDPLEAGHMDEGQHMEIDILPPHELEDEVHGEDPSEDTQTGKGPIDAHMSDNEDEDVEDQRLVTASLIPDSGTGDTTDGAHQLFSVPDPSETSAFTMKLEEVEGADALHLAAPPNMGSIDQSSLQLPRDTNDHWVELPKMEAMDTSQALKESSQNPTMNSQPGASTSATDTTQSEPKQLWTPEQAKALRSSVLSLSERSLFLSMDQLSLSDDEFVKSVVAEDPSGPHTTFDLSSIFPELQPFSMIDLPNSEIVGNGSDGKKKNDRKTDKDDPTKRVEETTYNKLCPLNRFNHVKPTLVSALQPAKKWRQGRWVDLDESPVVSDVDSPPTLSGAENSCTLFEGRRISIPFQPPLILNNFSKMPRTHIKGVDIPWSPTEDNLLKNLAERYPSNWRLVADALNSSRIRTSTDLRTPQECFERWRVKCGLPTRQMNLPPSIQSLHNEEAAPSSSALGLDNMPPPSTSASVNTSQMTTRGIKRLATSALQNTVNLSVNTGSNTVESRKRKRHLLIYEAVRKTLVKRQKQRKQDEIKYQTSSAIVAPVHDTHPQFNSQTRLTPLALSRIKAERERREIEAQMARRKELEAKRQQQQHQLHAQLQQAAQQQQQQQQQVGQQNANLQQGIPQIRAQMMQQVQVAQQARALAQAAQVQVQQPQAQANQTHIQGQLTGTQSSINGTVPHLSAQYVNHAGAGSPVPQQTSPPRSGATPVNPTTAFPRPPSAQRNVTMPGAQVLPMAGSSVPIARTNNSLVAYFANNGGAQYTPEQMSQLMRYQQAQQAQQLQLQQQQQQQPVQMQMQMQAGQQNAHQAGMTGYPSAGQ